MRARTSVEVAPEVTVEAEQLVVSWEPGLDDVQHHHGSCPDCPPMRSASTVNVVDRQEARVIFPAACAAVAVGSEHLPLEPLMVQLAFFLLVRKTFFAIRQILRPEPFPVAGVVGTLVSGMDFARLGHYCIICPLLSYQVVPGTFPRRGGWCSAGMAGIEPTTSGFGGRRATVAPHPYAIETARWGLPGERLLVERVVALSRSLPGRQCPRLQARRRGHAGMPFVWLAPDG